jgi:hypothetical protein
MFCPNCGLENAKGQKFCRRCGANLLALDLARDFMNEVATGQPVNRVESGTILKIVALISSLGMVFVTGGVIALSIIQSTTSGGHSGPPMSLFLAMFGYGAIVLICWRLLKLLESAQPSARPPLAPVLPVTAPSYSAPALHGQTNRNLGEAPPYHSVIEQETQQFQSERRNNS